MFMKKLIFSICVLLATLHVAAGQQSTGAEEDEWTKMMMSLQEKPSAIEDYDVNDMVTRADQYQLNYMVSMLNLLPDSALSDVGAIRRYVHFLTRLIEEYYDRNDFLHSLSGGRMMRDFMHVDYDSDRAILVGYVNYLRNVANLIQMTVALGLSDSSMDKLNYGNLHLLEKALFGNDVVMQSRNPYYPDAYKVICGQLGLDYEPQVVEDAVLRRLGEIMADGDINELKCCWPDIIRLWMCSAFPIRGELISFMLLYASENDLWDELIQLTTYYAYEYFPAEACKYLLPSLSLRLRSMGQMIDMSNYMKVEAEKGNEYIEYMPWACPEELKNEDFAKFNSNFLRLCKLLIRCLGYELNGMQGYKFNSLLSDICDFFGVRDYPQLLSVVGNYAVNACYQGSLDAVTIVEDILRIVDGGMAFDPVVMAMIAELYCQVNDKKTEWIIDKYLLEAIEHVESWVGGRLDESRHALICMTVNMAALVNKEKYASVIERLLDEAESFLDEIQVADLFYFYNSLSHIYIELGNYDKAQTYVDMSDKLLDSKPSDSDAMYLSYTRFRILCGKGKYDEVLDMLPDDHFKGFGPLPLLDVMKCAVHCDDYRLANAVLDEFIDIRGKSVADLLTMTIQDGESFCSSIRTYDAESIEEILAVRATDSKWKPLKAALLYDWSLITKGASLETRSTFHKYMLSGKNKDVVGAYNLFNKSMEHDTEESKDALITDEQYTWIASYEFADIMRADTSFLSSRQIKVWQGVQGDLGRKEYAVEYLRLDETYYAVILGRRMKRPVFVRIGRGADILAASQSGFEEDLYDDKQSLNRLYGLLWRPLTDHIPEGARVYYSLDGILNLLNIDLLCDDKMNYISEKYDMVRVSTTADIPSLRYITDYSDAVFYGNLNYNMNRTEITMDSDKYLYNALEQDRGVATEFVIPRDRLYATKTEICSAAERLSISGIKSHVFEWNNGTEFSFKALSGQNFDLLHLATHGFWWGSDKDDSGNYIPPMRRSGIVLSGSEDEPINSDKAGVLFADEIAGLDLSSVKLLVLSACQTAGGEVQDDGVFGLQRGFKQAGVGTIIMTLWPVESVMTKDLIDSFYGNLASGMDVHTSFVQARAHISTAYPNTRDWAAFIMLD